MSIYESQRRDYILWFSFLGKFSRVSNSSMTVVVAVVSNDCCYCRYRQFNILPEEIFSGCVHVLEIYSICILHDVMLRLKLELAIKCCTRVYKYFHDSKFQ